MLIFKHTTISYIQRGEIIEGCCVENHPQIIRYIDADDQITAQYIVAVEKQALLQSSNLVGAVYALFSIHYIFNNEYHPRLKDFISLFKTSAFRLKIIQLRVLAIQTS